MELVSPLFSFPFPISHLPFPEVGFSLNSKRKPAPQKTTTTMALSTQTTSTSGHSAEQANNWPRVLLAV